MNHLSLFSGIGGFDLAAEWMAWDNIAHCEWNPFCQKILKYYWPNAISYEDITKTDFTIHRGDIDIITGGFPCQPYSTAGLRKGKDDERHLWPHMLRAIREVKPRWVLGENVRGLISWNGGLVFEEVQADLEAAGYEVQPYLLPASGVNAPHQRERIWFIAHATNIRSYWNDRGWAKEQHGVERRATRYKFDGDVCKGASSDTDSRFSYSFGNRSYWQNFPTQSPVCPGDDGIPSRLDGITFSKWQKESIKGGGNAIVPQVAYNIFKAIQEYENLPNQQHSGDGYVMG